MKENLKGKPLFLSFQGVETAFYVWMNGKFVGYSEDTFTPSEFNITDFVKEGKNRLAVEVYKRSSASWLEDQDFWRFSGIFRDVYLYACLLYTSGMVIGAIMLDGSLANAYQAAQSAVQPEVIHLFGLKIEMVGFQGGIIIALMMGYVVAKLDVFFSRKIPDVVKLLVAPMLTVFISTVLLFTIIGPAGRILSNGITNGLVWSTENLGAFGYALFAGLQQIVVITGLHHIIGACLLYTSRCV